MSNYAKRLAADDKAVKAEQAILAEANAKAQVEQKISALTAQKATIQAAYNAALGKVPFSIENVFSLTAEMEANAKNLAIANSILTNEFGD